jgi:hypothetical protein
MEFLKLVGLMGGKNDDKYYRTLNLTPSYPFPPLRAHTYTHTISFKVEQGVIKLTIYTIINHEISFFRIE